MTTKEIIQKVSEYVEPFIAENKLELVDIEYVKEGSNYYLRLYIDKEGGVFIDDCKLVSKYLESKLEEDEVIERAYILEVSSPGIDRILKKDYEYEKYKGRIVDVKLYSPLDGKKEMRGELVGLIDGNIVIKCDEKEHTFLRKEVATCRLAVIF